MLWYDDAGDAGAEMSRLLAVLALALVALSAPAVGAEPADCGDSGNVECLTDKDCASGEVCVPLQPTRVDCGGTCRAWDAECTTDVDCAECAVCIPSGETRRCSASGISDCQANTDCETGEICKLYREDQPHCGGNCEPEREPNVKVEVLDVSCGVAGPSGSCPALALLALVALAARAARSRE